MTIYGLKGADIYEWSICAAKLTPMQISVIVVISSLTGNDHQGPDTQLNSKVYKLCANEHSVKLCTLMCCSVELHWYSYELCFLRLT